MDKDKKFILDEELEIPDFCNSNKQLVYQEHLLMGSEEEIGGDIIMCEEKKDVTQKENFEVPENDMRSNFGPPGCHNLDPNCAECCGILDPNTGTAPKFGVNEPIDGCDCHDICVQEVRLICAKEVDCFIKVPGIAGRRIGCRGEREVDDLNGPCKLIVTCADERIREDCKAIILRVGIQIIFGDLPRNTRLILDRVLEFTCRKFYPFPEGDPVRGHKLSRELRKIDGSCVVVNLDCEVLDDQEHEGEPVVRIFGTIVDKLWKNENIWVTGLRPYKGITVKHEFPEPHKIGDCTSEDEECPFARDDD